MVKMVEFFWTTNVRPRPDWLTYNGIQEALGRKLVEGADEKPQTRFDNDSSRFSMTLTQTEVRDDQVYFPGGRSIPLIEVERIARGVGGYGLCVVLTERPRKIPLE